MNNVTFEHGRDRPPTTGELEAQARRGRWLVVFPDGRRLVGRDIAEVIVPRAGMHWYAIVDRGDEYETIPWPIAPKADLDAIEAQANHDRVFCAVCDIVATKTCRNPECGTSRCDDHAVDFDCYCDHDWQWPEVSPEVVLALVAELRDAYAALNSVTDRLAAHEADLAAAAGELPVPVPPPGSDAARLLTANVLLRRENSRFTALVNRVRTERAERAAWLTSLPAGSCGNPPPASLLDAEAATGDTLASIERSES